MTELLADGYSAEAGDTNRPAATSSPAFLSWLLLRRGFAVNSVSAGLVGGALAGLCGVTMLELHCVNFEALHVLVWHTAVVPVSAAAGALVGWALRSRSKLA